MSRFPRSSERGPIEASSRSCRTIRPLHHFRAHPSAAPLKLETADTEFLLEEVFPRSSERGPIEAQTVTTFRARSANFRAHPSAAPLKLQVPGVAYLVSFISALIRARPH